MSESPDLFPYAKQPMLRPTTDLARDEQVQEENSTQTRGGGVIHLFAENPRLGRGLNGLSASHLTAIVEQLPPKPTFGQRAEADEGYIPPQGDSTPKPEEQGAAAASSYSSAGEDDESDDDFEAEDKIVPEATDNVNPEKLVLLEEKNPYGKKSRKGWMGADRASQAACLASLTRPFDAFRPVQKYKSLKAKSRVLTPDQFRRIWQQRQQDPQASKVPLRLLELVVPKPEYQTQQNSNLTARSDATTQAATKQASRPASFTAKAKNALNSWMEQTAITPSAPKPTLDTEWHFSCEDSKMIKRSNWPAPGF